MRVIRFTPKPGSELGNDPLFGLIEEDDQTISVINGDPLFNGIAKSGQITKLEDVRLLAPVLPRSKVVCVGRIIQNMQKRWAEKFRLNQLFS
jgi:2-keto-4-pentenoate hydratase/2-oxohepta-3-ene-1,7-dioic acid hydratase in catechol pathway